MSHASSSRTDCNHCVNSFWYNIPQQHGFDIHFVLLLPSPSIKDGPVLIKQVQLRVDLKPMVIHPWIPIFFSRWKATWNWNEASGFRNLNPGSKDTFLQISLCLIVTDFKHTHKWYVSYALNWNVIYVYWMQSQWHLVSHGTGHLYHLQWIF